MDWSLIKLAILFAGLASMVAPARGQDAHRPSSSAAAPARAAPEAAPSKPQTMRVRHVQSNEPGCAPTCAEWISAEGEIDAASPGEFRKVLARLGHRKLPVLIDSPGGSIDPAFAIARMIRARGLDVIVTRTALAPCAPHDKDCLKLKSRGIDLGRPEAKISKCASSCAFVLAGGVRRSVGPWTVVGLHEIRAVHTMRLVRQHYRVEPSMYAPARRQLLRQETIWSNRVEGPADEKVYERVRKFFEEMGVTSAVMPIMRSAPSTSIRWLRSADLNATGLATHFVNGEQWLLAPAPQAPAPPAAEMTSAIAAPPAATTQPRVGSPPPAVPQAPSAAGGEQTTASPLPAATPPAVLPSAASRTAQTKARVAAKARPKLAPPRDTAPPSWRPF